ncbi:flagellar hook assembly protein FlgD [Parvularcula marina]|uniref:Basal-body rod modification protein FlgD n=1 Tax=Parvularcula marina TaxID=2292771 RepID=A0A371RH14_9PROT|nr:flagellar hook capping FlgD N-terminal domain-containing protein [Parvularcula marina]RFB04730.1 hypothetical protein DX908_05215 [Parvularcula marina]
MQTTDATAAAAAGTPATSSTAASAALSSDFDSFIRLLTTQVTNQDPLEPLDSTQFVEQLATFSALEQQIATNAHLESIASLLQAQLGQGGELLGKTILAPSITAEGPFDNLTIAAPGVEEGALVVRNSAGDEVYRGPVGNEWTWNGRNADGDAVGLDFYTFEIETPSGSVTAGAIGEVDRIVTTNEGQVVGLGDGVLASNYTVL